MCLLVPAGSPGDSPKVQNRNKLKCFVQMMEMQGADIGELHLHLYPPSWGGVFPPGSKGFPFAFTEISYGTRSPATAQT